MPIILKSPRAKSDLVEIWTYIAENSEARADSFIDSIDEKLKALAQCPGMGSLRNELADGLRSLSMGRYVVFYRILSDGIAIVRVLHGARDLNAAFFVERDDAPKS